MKALMTLIFATFFAFSLAGCENGAAEKTGEKIDRTMENAGDAIEDACEDVTDKNC